MILGVDLGQKITGLAISEGHFAQVYQTIQHQTRSDAVNKISKVCRDLEIKAIVVGFVEGKIKSYFDKFAKEFKSKNPNLEIVLWDETLTTRQARDWMIKHKIPKSRRKQMEHKVAAALILQSYLDEKSRY